MSKRSKMLTHAALGAALGVWSVSQANASLQYQFYYGGSQATSWTTTGATDSRVFDVYAIISGAGIVEGGLTDAGLGISLTTGAGTNVASATATVNAAFHAPGYSVGSPTAPVNGVSGIGGASVLSDTGWINYRAATSSYFVAGTLTAGEVRLPIGQVTVSVTNITSGNPITMGAVVRNAGTFNTQIWYESTQAGYAGSTASAGARADFSTGPAVVGYTGLSITLGTSLGNPGDVNLDLEVNGFDLDVIYGHWGDLGGPPLPWTDGDLNQDGEINGFDLDLVYSNWGNLYAPIEAAVAVVPEPASVGLLILGASLLLRRRR